VAFIFSHSALREGWDNPNVFQICTLAQSHSEVKKRQEIGRGIRLCVDVRGRRVRDPDVNVLQVFANSSYEDWVGRLQSEDTGWDDADRSPLPRRATDGWQHRRIDPEAPVQWPTAVDVDRLVAAVARIVGQGRGPGCTVDRVEDRLHHDAPACPLRRSTVKRIVEAVPAAEPTIVARAIRQALTLGPHGVEVPRDGGERRGRGRD
jgi:hypothetical protein